MYTQCPHCQTIFGVSEDHLSAAYGRVRCGVCHSQFNARRHLLDEIPKPQQEATQPSPSRDSEPPANAATPTEPEIIETDIILLDDIPSDEIEHIELSSPDEDETATDEEWDEPEIEAEQTSQNPTITAIPDTTAPPLVNNSPDKAELDAIFADLDHRLEALSEDSKEAVLKPFEKFETGKGPDIYQDDFGDPDSQTEDDIKLSIETIFAAAEAELDTSDTPAPPQHDVTPDAFLADIDVEFLGVEETDQADDEHASPDAGTEDVFITETEAEVEDFDLAAEQQAAVAAEAQAAATSEPQTAGEPAFEQEEFPFLLHEDMNAEPAPPRGWLKTTALSLSIVILLAGVIFQLALFRNVELANILPASKPYLVRFCQYLPCQFSGKRDVSRIQLTSRDVRSHPGGGNTILISAIFVNNAPFAQPYPDILITLSDLTSTVVAQRRFTPADYLDKQAGAFRLMKPGKPVQISLEVLDPGNDAVNFQFDFL